MDFFVVRRHLSKSTLHTPIFLFFSGTPDVSSCCSLSCQNSMKCFDHFPEIGLSKSEFQLFDFGKYACVYHQYAYHA